MVLTDREIQVAVENKQIVIDPLPNTATAYSSTSVDLTLHRFIRTWIKPKVLPGVEPVVVSPGTAGFKVLDCIKEYTDRHDIAPNGFTVEPGQFLLAYTEETVWLPPFARIAGRVEGKSSLARVGIGVHLTAPTIHAGFTGQIQLEIFNNGSLRVKLLPGMPVCQLVFEQTLGTPAKGYSGQFLGQKAGA